jgi:hypothetical protein
VDVLLEIHNTRSIIRSSEQQARQQPSQQKQQQTSGINTHRDSNQISGQSVQTGNINMNATGHMFLALTMVEQI